jgi:lipopolysaccharide exporter
MKKILNKILSTTTFQHISIATVSTILTGGLGAIFYMLSARILGPANFGILMVAVTTVALLSDIGNLATDPGLVRFVGKNYDSDKKKALQFLKLSFEIKLALCVFLIIFGWLGAPYLADSFFHKPELTFALRLGFIGSASYIIVSFPTTFFQAIQKFWFWTGIQVGSNLIRLLIVLLLWIYGSFTLENTLTVYVFVPLGIFIASFFFLPKGFLKSDRPEEVRKELFHFNKWVALYATIAALSTRLDTFISARLLSSADVGYYSAANQLVIVVPQFISAFGAILAPKLSNIGDKKEFLTYYKKVQALVFFVVGLGILAAPVVMYLIPYIYGAEYSVHVPMLFLILLAAMLIFLAAIPIHSSILYYYGEPKVFAYTAVIQLFITIVIGWFLISSLGVIGAAFTVLLAMISIFVIPAIWLWRKVSQ